VRLEETDARSQMCRALVVEGLECRKKILNLMGALQRSLEGEWEHE